MTTTVSLPATSTGRLLRATGLAIAVAALVLVTAVLPAEYGIDPTGVGAKLGLDALGATAQAAEPELPIAQAPTPGAANDDAANVALAAKAEAAFGQSEGQSLDAHAISASAGTLRQDTLTLTLAPGKGAEVKTQLKSGDGMVFRWNATGDVAVDMHGERPDAKNAWTSYAVEAAQREGAGTFVAPFDGSHGWYWKNRGTQPVTVHIEVTGFQPELYRP